MSETDSRSKIMKNFRVQFVVFVSLLIMVSGLILLPPVFESTLSFGNLLPAEKGVLWKVSPALLLSAAILFMFRRSAGLGFAMLFFIGFIIFAIELFFRAGSLLVSSEDFKKDMEVWGNFTHHEESAYKGHPFLQFSGRSSANLIGSEALRGFKPFNNFGFAGNDFYHYKKPHTIRIACLGESTTADGYPWHLEQYLNGRKSDREYNFEVLNFGHAHWTTAHSVVNFFLNIVDFNPDIIVIHHAWNEEKVRGFDENVFRNDYSHVFKSFQSPYVYDRLLIRYSAIYRYVKFSYDQSPLWASLAGSIQLQIPKEDWSFNNLDDLQPFERNIKTIVDHSNLNGMKVFMATIPRTTDSTQNLFYAWKSIDQCNQLVRDIHEENTIASVLVDLDRLVTGTRNDIFTDLAHVNNAGRDLKAQIIGDSILAYVSSKSMVEFNRFNRLNQIRQGLYYYRTVIGGDSVWMSDVKRKALEKQISVDSMIVLDAIHMMNEDKRWYESKIDSSN